MCQLEGGGPRKAVWMTYKARRAVINKRRVFARHKDIAHLRCKEANRNAAREVRCAKYNYEKKLGDNVKYDAKSFYAYVRSRGNSRAGVGVLSRDDGGRVESPDGVAEEFNEYVSFVFSVMELECVPMADNGPVGGG